MPFRILKPLAWIVFGVLLSGAVVGQSKVGDWEFRVESEGSESESRMASTVAQPATDGGSNPNLVIRQKEPDSPIELLITATHDKEQDSCDYKDWGVSIDTIIVPILGHTFEPAKTVLKAKLEISDEELWALFRKGLQLAVQAEQKCDSFAGVPKSVRYTFSLRGSNAAYQLLRGGVE